MRVAAALLLVLAGTMVLSAMMEELSGDTLWMYLEEPEEFCSEPPENMHCECWPGQLLNRAAVQRVLYIDVPAHALPLLALATAGNWTLVPTEPTPELEDQMATIARDYYYMALGAPDEWYLPCLDAGMEVVPFIACEQVWESLGFATCPVSDGAWGNSQRTVSSQNIMTLQLLLLLLLPKLPVRALSQAVAMAFVGEPIFCGPLQIEPGGTNSTQNFKFLYNVTCPSGDSVTIKASQSIEPDSESVREAVL